MTDGRKNGYRASWQKTLGAVATAVGAVLAVAATVAEIDAWLTRGPSVIGIAALLALLVGLTALCYGEADRGKKLASGAASAVVGVILLAAVVLPGLDGHSRNPQEFGSGATSATGKVQKRPGSGVMPSRTLEGWARDVNHACSLYAPHVREDQATFHMTSESIVDREQEYRRFEGTPEWKWRVQDFHYELEDPMNSAFPPLYRTKGAFMVIENEVADLAWPSRPSDEKRARSWWKVYAERADAFDEVHRHWARYIDSDDPASRTATLAELVPALRMYQATSQEYYSERDDIGVAYCD